MFLGFPVVHATPHSEHSLTVPSKVPWKTVAWNALCLNLNIGFMNLTLSESVLPP